MTDAGLAGVLIAERPLLLRLLRGRGLAADAAEDIVQDLWVKLDTQPPGPVGDPVAYLCRMAVNLAADRRLAAARAMARGRAWMAVQPDAAEAPDAERALAARQEWDRVMAAVAQMPPRMAQALHWFRLERVGQREIAARLGITVSGVEKLLRRGYAELARLTPDGADSVGPRRLGDKGDKR